jgi:Ca2+-transporting ATPase
MYRMKPTAEFTSLSAKEALRVAGSSMDGLSADEAERRLHALGKNRLPRAKRPRLLRRILEQIFNPLILILLAVAAITPLLGHPTDAIVILIVLVFNATIGIVQEGRASRSLEALERTFVQTSLVRRMGREERIASDQIVPGDLVILNEGDIVPADGRLVESYGLRIDEASLTGESAPVDKTTDALVQTDGKALGDLVNAAFAQTLVVAGRGILLVTATGSTTEVGQIAAELSHAQTEPPLAAKVRKLGRSIAVIVMAFSALLFLFGLLAGRPPLTLFATVMSLAVSIIPEGLPIVLTLVLSRGVSHMAAKNAVVKKLNAVEGLGQVNVICTDKTGTLTTNHLVVERARTMTDDLVLGAALFGASGDPINAALHAFAREEGVNTDGWQLVEERPFDYRTRYRSARFKRPGEQKAFLVGSPEGVLAVCAVDKTTKATIHAEILEAAREGLRVIALASRDGKPSLDDTEPWQFAGFVGMSDTLRPRVEESVAWCREQGIRVVMITGDHPETAFAIAKRAGIAQNGDRVVSGPELETMDDTELTSALNGVRVFARIAPTHKLRIVNAYRATGLVTAMTGDGVNDAPALHRADIGISMGKGGTDVAREASHLILMDDNFATIVDAIKEGRATIANVRRVITYLFSTSIAEASLISITLVAGFPLPLLPGQIIWINLVTDSFLDISLGMEPPHGSTGERHGALIDRRSVVRMILLGSTMAVGTFIIYSRSLHADPAYLQTLTLTTLAVFQWLNAWNARSETRSLAALPLFSNRPLIASTGIVIGLQLLAVYAPPFQTLLGTVPLSVSDWSVIVGLASMVILVDEIWKKARHKPRGTKPLLP